MLYMREIDEKHRFCRRMCLMQRFLAVEIRRFHSDDAEVLFELVETSRDFLNRWVTTGQRILTTSDASAYLETAVGDSLHWAITCDGRVVGSVKLFESGNCNEVGIWLGRDYIGQGIGSMALSELLKILKDTSSDKRLLGRCDPSNRRMRAVFEKHGFMLSSRQDGLLVYEYDFL